MTLANNQLSPRPDKPREESRLHHFPVSFFAIIMGLSGLTLAWRAAGQSLFPNGYLYLGSVSTLVMCIVTIFYLAKMIRHPLAVNITRFQR